VLVADHPNAEDGVEFLRRTQRHTPESLRILVIDNKEIFVEIRGANLARVDSFLLREEAPEHLSTAIEDALARREQDRQRMLLNTDSVRRLFSSRLTELDQLIEQREFEFAYQPIVDPRTRTIMAYEALCRAKHPVFRNPQVLFDAAVQSGCLWKLGKVTREIAAQGLSMIPEDVKLFLNLHPGEVDDPDLIHFAENSNIAHRIVFEITERASIPDYNRFKEMTSVLGERGFQFAVDDLGAGYAGLNAVALLSPEFIKIDMAMIRGIDMAPRRAKLIRRIVEFANDVGIKLIAEGIETPQEAEAIAKLGCHLSQGYFFGRPHTQVP
jgi:EAL domain-containing protein (putative c-di-GMP-specific phosphodiesterase class I)